MHIRTNVELSFIHIVVLAICPLMLIMTSATQALYFISATIACFLISTVICMMFNKYLNNNVKVFLTALISVFLITMFNFAVEKYQILGLKETFSNSYFAVISVIILSIDSIFIHTKANSSSRFFMKYARLIFVFAMLTMIYAIGKEFLAFGTIFEKRPFIYKGYEFFKLITFDFIWLGLICFFAEIIHRKASKRRSEKRITYQKFIKKIRNEKIFQYDNLRRKKLLVSEINTNKIDGDKIEEIKEKEDENEVVDVEDDAAEDADSSETPAGGKKKKKKMKFSKETKVEKLYDRQSKEGK